MNSEEPSGLLSPLPGFEREHLNRGSPRYTFRSGLAPWGAWLFGGLFVLVGLGIVGLAAEWLPVEEGSKKAPDAVIATIGIAFSGAGLMVIGMGIREGRRLKIQETLRRRYPDESEMQDHPWDREGFTPPRWKSAIGAFVVALFLAIFLSVFNWFAWFHEERNLFVQFITVLFDLVLLAVIWGAIAQLYRAVRFGNCRVHYPRFPMRPGERIELRFTLPSGITQVRHAVMRLRCLQEYTVTRGTGKSRSTTPYQDQLYLDEKRLEAAEIGSMPRELRMEFDLPAEGYSTNLDAKLPVAWEVELELEVPGINAVYPFLLPIYRA